MKTWKNIAWAVIAAGTIGAMGYWLHKEDKRLEAELAQPPILEGYAKRGAASRLFIEKDPGYYTLFVCDWDADSVPDLVKDHNTTFYFNPNETDSSAAHISDSRALPMSADLQERLAEYGVHYNELMYLANKTHFEQTGRQVKNFYRAFDADGDGLADAIVTSNVIGSSIVKPRYEQFVRPLFMAVPMPAGLEEKANELLQEQEGLLEIMQPYIESVYR